ncbi:MAG: class I SAM-dependent methyltransferase [Phycisphaerales bacterium]
MSQAIRKRMTSVEDRLMKLRANAATHELVRSRFGAAIEPGALEAISRAYCPPAWAVGAIGILDAMFLWDMVACARPERVVEVGVASGTSSALLLRAIEALGAGVVDEAGRPRLMSYELHPYCYFDRTIPVGAAVAEVAADLGAGLSLRVGGTAATAGRELAPQSITLAFIDADHRHPCPTADVLALAPAMARGGWIVLHDIDLPNAAKRYENAHGTRVDWHQAGAEILFERWPFEKLRGVGEAGNIGAIRLPTERALRHEDLRPAIGAAWETEPAGWVREVLGDGAA